MVFLSFSSPSFADTSAKTTTNTSTQKQHQTPTTSNTPRWFDGNEDSKPEPGSTEHSGGLGLGSELHEEGAAEGEGNGGDHGSNNNSPTLDDIGDIFGLSTDDVACVDATSAMVKHQPDFLAASTEYTNAMEIHDSQQSDGTGGGDGDGSLGQTNVQSMITGFTLTYPSDDKFDTYHHECDILGGQFLFLQEGSFSCQASNENGDAATYFGLTNENDGTDIELYVTIQNFASCVAPDEECDNFNLQHLLVEVWDTFGLTCVEANEEGGGGSGTTQTSASLPSSTTTTTTTTTESPELTNESGGGSDIQKDTTDNEDDTGGKDDHNNKSGASWTSTPSDEHDKHGTNGGPSTEVSNNNDGNTAESMLGKKSHEEQQEKEQLLKPPRKSLPKHKHGVFRAGFFLLMFGFIVTIVAKRRRERYDREVTRRLYEMTDIHFIDQVVDFHDVDFMDSDDDDDIGNDNNGKNNGNGKYRDHDTSGNINTTSNNNHRDHIV